VEYFECAEEAGNSNSVRLFNGQEEQAEEGNEFTQIFRMTHIILNLIVSFLYYTKCNGLISILY